MKLFKTPNTYYGVMKTHNVRMLEGALTIPILITLHEHEGELMKQVLTSMIESGRNTSQRRYDELEQAGLVQIRKGRMKNSGHWVSLTEKGKQIAEHLIAIEKILSD